MHARVMLRRKPLLIWPKLGPVHRPTITIRRMFRLPRIIERPAVCWPTKRTRNCDASCWKCSASCACKRKHWNCISSNRSCNSKCFWCPRIAMHRMRQLSAGAPVRPVRVDAAVHVRIVCRWCSCKTGRQCPLRPVQMCCTASRRAWEVLLGTRGSIEL